MVINLHGLKVSLIGGRNKRLVNNLWLLQLLV
jgi:hypothetical protein